MDHSPVVAGCSWSDGATANAVNADGPRPFREVESSLSLF
jgi:hypothetical protein